MSNRLIIGVLRTPSLTPNSGLTPAIPRLCSTDMSETAPPKPVWVDDGINIQRCSPVPSAVPLKYDSITLWDKMNRIHHFDVFVRFVRLESRLGWPPLFSLDSVKKPKRRKSLDATKGWSTKSIKLSFTNGVSKTWRNGRERQHCWKYCSASISILDYIFFVGKCE